jgi:hypothetical protein
MARLNAKMLMVAPTVWSRKNFVAVLRTLSFGSTRGEGARGSLGSELSRVGSSSSAAAAIAMVVGCRVWEGNVDSRNCCLARSWS